jgi:hypothetical protein
MRYGKHVCALVCVAALGASLVAPAGAGASDKSIRRTIAEYAPAVSVSEGQVASGVATFQATRNASPAETAFVSAERLLRSLRTALSGQIAVSPDVKQGKADVLTGVTGLIHAYQYLETAFDVHGVSRHTATVQAAKAATATRWGQHELAAGLALLNQ